MMIYFSYQPCKMTKFSKYLSMKNHRRIVTTPNAPPLKPSMANCLRNPSSEKKSPAFATIWGFERFDEENNELVA